MKNRQKANLWMSWQLQTRPTDFMDSAGEFNCTKLAEECADHFDIYENEDFDIPEWLFDLAVDVTEDL